VSSLKPPVSASDHRAGPQDAPVTLVEYGDYECPHCAAAHPIVHEVRRQMGRRLLFVFRHFPLSNMHPNAERAAEAAEAAAAQGEFWKMHDALFAEPGVLEDADLQRRARTLGLDVAHLERDLSSHVHQARVRHDFQSGVRSGVNGTPTFFINGVRHDDSWDVETLVAALLEAAEA
jgi:protein-disulfide isomerase